MEYFLSRSRFPAAQNDNRHLNVAKNRRIARQFADRSGTARPLRTALLRRNHRVVTARMVPLTTPPAGKTAGGASQSNEDSARFDAPPRRIYPIDHDRTATLRSQSRDRT
jgi:hypothetical protein